MEHKEHKEGGLHHGHFEFPVDPVPLPWVIFVCYTASRVTLSDPETGELQVDDLEDTAPKRINPWIMRERMLAAVSDSEILRFLNDVGGCSDGEQPLIWHLGHFRYMQDTIRALMGSPVDSWGRFYRKQMRPDLYYDTVMSLLSPLAPSVDLVDGRLAVSVQAQNFMDVISATLQIDKLRGVKHRKCGRIDCPRMFEVVSLHRKQYCTQSCAHLVSVRRTREKKRRMARGLKGNRYVTRETR